MSYTVAKGNQLVDPDHVSPVETCRRSAQRHRYAPQRRNAPRHGRRRSRRRRLWRRSHRQSPAKARRGNLRQRSGSLCSHRLHGQSDCYTNLDASWQRSDLRRTRPRQSLRTCLHVCHRRMHAARRSRWRRRHPDLEADRSRHPSQRSTTIRKPRWSAWKTPATWRAAPSIHTERVDEICNNAHALGLKVHLDGARIFNAAAALNEDVAHMTEKRGFRHVLPLERLGRPRWLDDCRLAEFIERARIYRKMFGGGMRQVGVLAAAGLSALEKSPLTFARRSRERQSLWPKVSRKFPV